MRRTRENVKREMTGTEQMSQTHLQNRDRHCGRLERKTRKIPQFKPTVGPSELWDFQEEEGEQDSRVKTREKEQQCDPAESVIILLKIIRVMLKLW